MMTHPDFDPTRFLPLTPLSFNILLALGDADRHGYGILKELERKMSGTSLPATGTLYLAIQRLEVDGLIGDSEQKPEPGRDDKRRRYYRLTPAGRLVAAAEARRLVEQLGVAYEKELVTGETLSRLQPNARRRVKE